MLLCVLLCLLSWGVSKLYDSVFACTATCVRLFDCPPRSVPYGGKTTANDGFPIATHYSLFTLCVIRQFLANIP